MLLTFTDKQGNKLSDFEVFFRFNDNKIIISTDEDGQLELTDGDEGAEIVCCISEEHQEKFKYHSSAELTIAFELPLEDMLFVVADKDGNSVTDLELFFEFNGEKIKEKTDTTGQLTLKNIPVKTKVRAFQLFAGKEVNEEFFICERNKAQYFYVAEHLYEKADMRFSLVDKSGQPVRKADIRFRYEGEEFEKVTDNNGKIVLKDIKIGSTVECKQMVFGKSLPIHKFKLEKGIDEYIIHGEKIANYNRDNENYEAQVRTKIRLVNSNNEPVPNAIIRIEYNEKTRNKYSNQNGEVQIDDVLLGAKVIAWVDVRGKKAEIEFVCEKDNELHEMVLKTDQGKNFLWIIPVLLIAGLAYFLTKVDFESFLKSKKTKHEIVKKDSLIINNYHITVKDKKTNSILKAALVGLKYQDSTYIELTDSLGSVDFKPVSNKLPVEITGFLPGYFKNKLKFKQDSIFTLYLSKDDSTDVVLSVLPCGNLTQSEGAKITIRTFNMKMREGRFKLFYNMFDLPDRIDVYSGSSYDLSEDKLIYSSEGLVKGLKTTYLNFADADSLITIKVTGGTNETKWLYKVFCARPLIKP
ncbi:MAG: hypothetical protein L3J74_18505 [Bacteroidales bacterium]|nr:hypothetical protein [Bacteroidales bacterium]